MKRLVPVKNIVVTRRFFYAKLVVTLISALLLLRLWYLQIHNGRYYQKLSENNRLRYQDIPAARGRIFDSFGSLILDNRPYYNLVVRIQFVEDLDLTFRSVSKLLNVSLNKIKRNYKRGRGGAKYKYITLKKNLTIHQVALVESNKIYIPGIDIETIPRRNYTQDSPAHLLGYLGKVTKSQLKSLKKRYPKSKYNIRSIVGKHGLEKVWEGYLRGKDGNRIVQVDALGRMIKNQHKYSLGHLPYKEATPGANLILTIDYELQKTAIKAFDGKNGAIVAMNPNTGEVLAIVSAPEYKANLFQSSFSYNKYRSIQLNPFSPFLDKTTGGKYAPGSIFKPIVALAALQEKVVTKRTTYTCNGSFPHGKDVFHCHNRYGHGKVNLFRSLIKSCDVFYYNIGIALGIDRIAKYSKMFGLGRDSTIRLNLNRNVRAMIPTSKWKKKTLGVAWKTGNTPPVSIGQGAVEMTPLQMASVYATIANRGKTFKPYIVKKVLSASGKTLVQNFPKLLYDIKNVEERYWINIQKALLQVVADKKGTGRRAYIPGIEIAGKTGTAQVISLKKNKTDLDTSMKWKDHAIFAAFSPSVNAEIVVAIISENDGGGGGVSVAPIAKKIIQKFWDLKKSRLNTIKKNTVSKKTLRSIGAKRNEF